MSAQVDARVLDSARRALRANRRSGVTVPHARMFPGAYLWDTAVIVKGIATFDPESAAAEVLALLRAQWRSGMLPNEVHFEVDRKRSWVHRRTSGAPPGMVTSAITQPPMIVRSILEVGRRMDRERRLDFYRSTFSPMARLCRWVLEERMGARGLAVVIHPYETGMDNRIDLADAMQAHWQPSTALSRMHTRGRIALLTALRSTVGDARTVPVAHRSSHLDVIAAILQMRHLARCGYDLAAVRASGQGLLVEDVGYNAVFLDALNCLRELADDLGETRLDELLGTSAASAADDLAVALSGLWQESPGTAGHYASRDHRTGAPLPGAHVATLFPLLVEQRPERVRAMLATLTDPHQYATPVPLPSAPADSPRFTPDCYWQGPVWAFPTDLVHTGLLRQGQDDLAAELRHRYLTRPNAGQHSEYDNPLTGEALGAHPFSPSAALALRFAAHP